MYNKNGSEIEVLRKEYAEICSRLEKICTAGEITEFVLRTILESSEMVLNQIARHYENVQKEVRSAMLGPAIQTKARTILDEGIRIGRDQGLEQGLAQGREQGLEQGLAQGREQGLEQGRAQGLTQGRSQVLVSLVKDGRLSVEEAAGYSELSIAEFKELCSE